MRATTPLLALACFLGLLAAVVPGRAQTNCAACWGAVTNWHGTWNLTLTGSSINDSSSGTFDITNGAHTVTGTGSVSGSFAGYCAETGSGALDASSSALVVINTTDCTFSLILNDRLMVSETITGYGTINSIQGVSGTTVSPVGTVPESVLPYFPLPAFGDPLVISGSFPAPNPGIACYNFGGAATLTISCTIEPQVQTGPPHFTQLPTGGSLGCNPADADIPGAADVLDNTSATSPSGQVSVSADVVDVTNGCAVTRSFTITATDECTEQEAHALVAYWWTEDTTPPVITGAPSGGSLGCNPASLPSDASVLAQVTSTDDCGVASNIVSHVDTTNNCTVTRTFTITATDDCGNVSPARTAVFTWTADTTPPVITGAPAGGSLGCNPANLPTDASVRGLSSATDGCGSATLNVSHSDSVAGCTTTRTLPLPPRIIVGTLPRPEPRFIAGLRTPRRQRSHNCRQVVTWEPIPQPFPMMARPWR